MNTSNGSIEKEKVFISSMKMLEEEQEKSNDFSEMIITIHFSPVMGKYCDGCFHIEWDKSIPTVNKWIYSVLRKIYFIF